MAFTSRIMAAPARDVFTVLTDPYSYPKWLIGTSKIRDVDAAWPAVGSCFHHGVGVGPLRLPDSTQVETIETDKVLKLRVRARPFILATASFILVDSGPSCVVMLEEEPKLRMLGNLVLPLFDPLTHVRNHESLRRLGELVDER